jgi:hypothetical protein
VGRARISPSPTAVKSSGHWPVSPRSADEKITTSMEATLVEEIQQMHVVRIDGSTTHPGVG